MRNVQPATVILLHRLRTRVPSVSLLQLRNGWLRERTLYSPKFVQYNARGTYSTATVSTTSPVVQYDPLRPRILSKPLVQEKDDIIAHVVKTASQERLYELLRIEASRGDFEKVQAYAECLLRKHKTPPNLRIYSALILANTSPSGSMASVLDYILQLREDGLDLDDAACHDVLKVLAVHPDYLTRADLLAYMQAKWLQLSDVGRHDLVAGYVRETAFDMAMDEMEHMVSDGVVIQPWLYDLVIYALAAQSEYDEVLRILRDRITEGSIIVSGALWHFLLDFGSEALHYNLINFVWKTRVRTHYMVPSSGNYLNILTAAARRGDSALATDVFRELGEREEVFEHQHYEMLIEAYMNSGDVTTALSVMCVMQDAKLTPNNRTTRAIWKYLSKDVKRSNQVFEELRNLNQYGKNVPTAAVNVIIEAACYHSDIELAMEYYKALHEICPSGANIDTFNFLIRGCGRRKDLALLLATEMLALNLKPNRLTYDRMLIVCLTDGSLDDAMLYYREMLAQRLQPRNGTILYLVKSLVSKLDERAFDVVDAAEGLDIGVNIAKIKTWMKTNWKGDPSLLKDDDLEM